MKLKSAPISSGPDVRLLDLQGYQKESNNAKLLENLYDVKTPISFLSGWSLIGWARMLKPSGGFTS